MNILICDDMPKEANKLKRLLAAQGIATSVFHHGRDALRYIEDGGFADVCILDIIMPEMTGIELAGRLRRTGWDGPIVFLSTSKEFGPETYQVL